MWDESEECAECGEPNDNLDPLGIFLNDQGEQVVIHGQCGIDAGFTLA